MELVNLPKTETKELSNAQKENLFESIVRGKDVIEEITTSRGAFKVKFPRAKDLELIGRITAYRLNGISEKCFDDAAYALFQQIATLDVVVVSGPAWYENAKEKNDNFSWADMPTQKFIQEVYAKAYEFRIKVQKLLDADTKPKDSAVASDKNAANTSDTGVFEGLSSADGKQG